MQFHVMGIRQASLYHADTLRIYVNTTVAASRCGICHIHTLRIDLNKGCRIGQEHVDIGNEATDLYDEKDTLLSIEGKEESIQRGRNECTNKVLCSCYTTLNQEYAIL